MKFHTDSACLLSLAELLYKARVGSGKCPNGKYAGILTAKMGQIVSQ